MIDLITYNYNKGYCLRLSDENNWWITGYEDGIKYVDNLAIIMELKECSANGSPKLIFIVPKELEIMATDRNVPSESWLQNFGAEWKYFYFGLLRLWNHANFNDIICEVNYKEKSRIDKYMFMWFSLHAIYRRSMKMGGLPFHAGLAEYKGRGILLAGQGGTGKSTCCHRLPTNKWKPLCDDEALIVLDKSKLYHVHPFPTWSDYIAKRAENTWNVQKSVPLSAIFFLEQSEKDEVIPLSKEQAVILITKSSVQVYDRSWKWINKNNQTTIMKDIFNSASEMARTIPAYRLRISLNGQFWEEIEKVLSL